MKNTLKIGEINLTINNHQVVSAKEIELSFEATTEEINNLISSYGKMIDDLVSSIKESRYSL
jgi:hypothetical protein